MVSMPVNLHARIFVPCRIINGKRHVMFRQGEFETPRLVAFKMLRDAQRAVELLVDGVTIDDVYSVPFDAEMDIVHTSTYDMMKEMHSFSVDICEIKAGSKTSVAARAYSKRDPSLARAILENAFGPHGS